MDELLRLYIKINYPNLNLKPYIESTPYSLFRSFQYTHLIFPNFFHYFDSLNQIPDLIDIQTLDLIDLPDFKEKNKVKFSLFEIEIIKKYPIYKEKLHSKYIEWLPFLEGFNSLHLTYPYAIKKDFIRKMYLLDEVLHLETFL